MCRLQVPPGVGPLAPDAAQEGGGRTGAPEGGQGEREEAGGELPRQGQRRGGTAPPLPPPALLRCVSKCVLLCGVQVEMDAPCRKRNLLDVFRIAYLRKRAVLMSLIW